MVLITSSISNLFKRLEDIHAELQHTNCLCKSQFYSITL